MDIKSRKPRVINLKGKKLKAECSVKVEVPVAETPKVHTDDRVIDAPHDEQASNYSCVQCGSPASKELGRCVVCDVEHQKIVAQLDAKPKQVIEKVPEKWVYYKQATGGVIVTVRMTEQEALMTGRRIQ